MKKLFLTFFLIGCFVSNSQPLINKAFDARTTDSPVGFVKYSNFTIVNMLSRKVESGLEQKYRVVGINNDGSIKFDQLVGVGVSNFIANGIPIGSCATSDKGMMCISKDFKCQAGIYYALITRVDSMGNTVFSNMLYDYVLAPQWIGGSFFFTGFDKQIRKIKPSDGTLTDTIFTEATTISAATSNSKKQIVFNAGSLMRVIDTLGNIILSTPGSATYRRIKSFDKNYYAVTSNGSEIHKLDSTLNITNTLTTGSYTVTDYSLSNDTLLVSLFNPGFDKSVVLSCKGDLSTISSTTLNIPGHHIMGVSRTNVNSFLVKETSEKLVTSGLSSFLTNSPISYPDDIAIKSVTTNSFFIEVTGNSSEIHFKYQHTLKIANNSSDTLKSFRFHHKRMKIPFGLHQTCQWSYDEHMDLPFSVSIPPNDSADVQLPLYSGYLSTSNPPSSPGIVAPGGFTLNTLYTVMAPNFRIDNKPYNNSFTAVNQTSLSPQSVSEVELNNANFLIYPNPVTEKLFIKVQGSFDYTIYDSKGSKITSGESNENEINMHDLNPGLYFIAVTVDGKTAYRKFLKE